MIISDTSALVLNWTLKDIWESKNARDYFTGLDLSAADNLLRMFDSHEDYMHTQTVSNRKYFMRNCAVEFLQQCSSDDVRGQVIILAAGIAPLSVEIASLYPNSLVFDVDKYLMDDKENYLGNRCPNIKFIACDITNIELLAALLVEKGWNIHEPGLLIMEGINYYLAETDLKNVLTFFAGYHLKFACDYGLKPACVNIKNRIYGIEVFRKIQELVGLDFLSFYEPGYFMSLVKQCGFINPVKFTMRDIQLQRTGQCSPFDFEEPGWIAVVKN
jgi:Leucine carboxyl methyltransferase